MTRLLRVIVHNWPLKFAAIGLATLLYGGFVLSQGAQTFNGNIAVQQKDLPDGVFLLSQIPPVTSVRYFAPAGVPTANVSFTAEVDLSNVDAKAGTVRLPVTVRALDDRISVISVEPPYVTVELDSLVSRNVAVEVVLGPVPDPVTVGEVQSAPDQVEVFGPQSIVSRVDHVRADVVIQPSGIDVDQDVILVPVDSLGNPLSPVEVDPRTARIKVPVFSDRKSRTLPVSPVITGTPAAGFEIASVTVSPLSATVEGDADQLAALVRLDTKPVSLTGASSDFEVDVDLDLPAGIVPLDNGTIRVTVALRPVTGTRTFEAGLRLVGARSDLSYHLATDRVLVTIGGSIADLDRLEGSRLVLDVAVGDLSPGAKDVAVSADLATGLTLVSVSPATVRVTVVAAASPSPAALVSPSPSPGA